ncbi:MAG: DUF1016 N-terminal domain-containing protein [Bacteroidetes bacterium]|nr:DUF1016 N-terminal domain-containing protein [Bacteroidota bacterium]MCL6102267.1 DUF1016 N-terminal domain-containing protein [Bacteroidota bacterium]
MELDKTSVYTDIKNILEQAKNNAVRAVNFSMVLAYWQIGKRIVEDEQGGNKKANYGEYLLKDLSEKLSAEFGKGFTYRNIAAMRQFYLAFPILHAARAESSKEKNTSIGNEVLDQSMDISIRDTLRPELSWSHYRLLMKVENPDARNYYIQECECIGQNWSTRTY